MQDSKSLVQFSGYFIVAALAVSVNIISRILLNFYMNFYFSVVIAYILGHFVNFYLSNKFIFKSSDKKILSKFLKFSLVASFGLFVAFAISAFSLKILQNMQYFSIQISEFIAHICGIGASFIFNFLGHKFFSFKDSIKEQK